MKSEKYVHGYSEHETRRLLDQAKTLFDLFHLDTSYPEGSTVLEAGCGVGAQTVMLAKNSPGAEITSIDISPDSIKQAQRSIKKAGIINVKFVEANIFDLPFGDECFDHVFVCFILEHLENPVLALEKLKKVLKPRGTITVIEGDHGSCYFYPETPESLHVWNCLIKSQELLGGNSLIGRSLYPLLRKAGFRYVSVSPRNLYIDRSKPKLSSGFIEKTIIAMLKGVKDRALELGLTNEAIWEKGIKDLHKTAGEDGTFCYTFFKGVGVK